MSQSIQVSFVQEGDVYTVHTGSSVLKDIVMDYTGVPETERGGNSSTLLIAAALSCFCGSILLLANGVGHHHVIKLSIKKKYSEKSRKYHDADQRNGKFCLKS